MRVLTDSRLLCRRMRSNLRVGRASGGASDAAELLALAYGPSEECWQSANEFQHCAATPHESVKIPQREGTDGSAATRLQVRLPASSKANSTSTRSLSLCLSVPTIRLGSRVAAFRLHTSPTHAAHPHWLARARIETEPCVSLPSCTITAHQFARAPSITFFLHTFARSDGCFDPPLSSPMLQAH